MSRLKPAADAGFTGSNSTLPAAMLDGTTTTGGWSSFYNKSATALLNAVSLAHASEWVSVSWPAYQTVGTLRPYFTLDAQRQLPAAYKVTYWDGSAFVPVKDLSVTEATGVQPADHAVVRPGEHEPGAGGDDEPGSGREQRVPPDRRARGQRRGHESGRFSCSPQEHEGRKGGTSVTAESAKGWTPVSAKGW